MDTNASVLARYSAGAKQTQPALCCPVGYDPALLAALPPEIVERDYGCGDPSRYVREGDVVLDLGSGGGKICYIAAQLVGDQGRVIGIDINDDMLALARKHQATMTERLGGNRVQFLKGFIQDLALDLDALEAYLRKRPTRSSDDFVALEDWQAQQRRQRPLIADGSIDLVVSNCVLNLVRDDDKQQLIREIHRVLKPGGRIAIADIVSDKAIPAQLKQDPELWSGCVTGAFQEQDFLQAFVDVSFQAVCYDKWETEPWQTIEGIEFRSVTVTAIKADPAPGLDAGQAVIYRGPYRAVTDDAGHVFPRGERIAVSENSYRLLAEAYGNDFIGIGPVEAGKPQPCCTPSDQRQSPQATGEK